MNGSRRPLLVTILGWVYLAVGVVGFAYHFREFQTRNMFPVDAVLVELVRLLAIVCGVFLLRGRDWARWLAFAWMAFHVVLSAFHNSREFALHFLLFALIAWILFRPETARYFHAGH